ncbi:DUF4382 domain-containing protein [Candidatus Woesearchaeota archaeon]|nr:DUF4382 domain-containing protein [Candidatus Woesearchaeota archaeon]
MKRIILISSLLLVIFLSACVQQPTAVQPSKDGRVVFVITDAAADMQAVSSLSVTVDSVKVHSATEGWVTVSSTPKTYDLLKLKAEGSKVLLTDIQLKEGTYQQVRLDISKVFVVDANGEHEAKLPSGELKIVGEVVVKPNTTSAVTFDFIADESLHFTGNGEYILAPVVHFETHEDADVEVKADGKVEIKAGKLKTKVNVGMDIDGNVGVGLAIGKDVDLVVDGAKIKLGLGIGKAKQQSKENISSDTSMTDGQTSSNTSVQVSV